MPLPQPYTASYTTGALLPDETIALLGLIEQVPMLDVSRLARKDPTYLPINSEAARKKIAGEILKRYRAVDADVWVFFRTLHQSADQAMVLLYVCLKTYNLLSDFALHVLVPRWQQRLLTLDRTDFDRFLDQCTPAHPELQKLTEATRRKLAQISLLMLKQAGLVRQGKLTTPSVSAGVWQFFGQQGDAWMLDVGMLTRADRERLDLLTYL
jgi:hypothetical protein